MWDEGSEAPKVPDYMTIRLDQAYREESIRNHPPRELRRLGLWDSGRWWPGAWAERHR